MPLHSFGIDVVEHVVQIAINIIQDVIVWLQHDLLPSTLWR